MKISQAIIFFGTVFLVYGSINYYIIRRIVSVVPDTYKTLAIIILAVTASSFVLGRILENYWYSYLVDFLIWIGSIWIAIMFYTFLCLVIVDLLRLINHFIPFIPKVFAEHPLKARNLVAVIIFVLVTSTVVGGIINSRMIAVKKYNLHLDKNGGNLKSLRIVMASDLHLGNIYGHYFMYDFVKTINSLKPDVVLLAGDIVDEDIAPLVRENLGEKFDSIKSKYGIYAVTGNHEFIGGVEPAIEYLTKHGIKFLRDTSVFVDNSFYLTGREDRDITRFTSKKRKPLDEILSGADKSFPIIMMDHQPFNLEQAEQNGIDLQLSGHTHNGQLWPLNHIVDKVYELAWGYKRKSDTHYYVSCGVGGWGPPVRTGSRPEIIKINLHFKE